MPDLPIVNRVSYADYARKAADQLVEPDRAGQVAAAACRLEPLQKMQVAFGQLVRAAEGRIRGEVGAYGHHFSQYAASELEGAKRHVEVLAVASQAAISMHKEMTAQLKTLEDAMAKKKDDDQKLTTDGSPHPLQEGGYDADKDAQLPSNISDVEALKEGKTTKAQNDAIAKADAADTKGDEPAKSDEAKPKDAAPAPAPTKPVQPVVVPKATTPTPTPKTNLDKPKK